MPFDATRAMYRLTDPQTGTASRSARRRRCDCHCDGRQQAARLEDVEVSRSIDSIGTQVASRGPGRPSLTAAGTHSPSLRIRLPQATRDALDAVADREGRRASDVVRDALDRYLQAADS